MSRYLGFDTTPERPAAAKAAVLLVNLGTPAAPTTDAVRDYLAEFLSDPRIVELPRWLWWPILHGYTLRRRPARSAEAYAKIWRNDGSPLLVFSERLTTAVRARIAQATSGKVEVALAMTYGEPSVPSTIESLMRKGIRHLLAFPLFPQYSATSTGAALDAVMRTLQTLRWAPALRTIDDYHSDAGYLAALVGSVQAHWAQHGRGDRLLLSFHGIPEKYANAGDPYPDQCHETARRLGDALGLGEDELLVTFQSRLGRQPWLRPYTDEIIEQLARQDVKALDVLCPGFAVDCLETLEEVALRYRASFLTNGGKQFRYIPALNEANAHASALAGIAMKGLAGWL
ncbi:MAG: ferrochelatase [Xanthomonadales bacterium]|nr:ferrochelatase [Xanthomonadales bacterium]ODU91828.1 MAG: ferrochelatase [Rhodanobacter sp. SCN 66-43]OJY84870.1 MAG: ferrochelatase [Xanthomonadales bacterium 66-474]